MKCYTTSFSGEILTRGFWLYVWRISSGDRLVWYVGRTGDNSSANAASPFGRLSQHLDLRSSATANMLARNLVNIGLKPEECNFNLLALGPLFPEQPCFKSHKPYRDIVSLLEAEIAHYLSQAGLEVLGSHPKRGKYDSDLFSEVLKNLNEFLDDGVPEN